MDYETEPGSDQGYPATPDDLAEIGHPEAEEVAGPPPQQLKRPRAGQALQILLAYIGVQLLCGVGVGIMVGVVAGVKGVSRDQSEEFSKITAQLLQYSLVPIMIVSGLVLLLLTRRMAADAMSDGDACGVGWRPSSLGNICGGAFLGSLISGGFLLAVIVLFSGEQPSSAGPLAEMASKPGVTRALFAILAVILAPFIEEFLFRGVLLAGFTRSFGLPIAVALCTFLFVVLHIGELQRFPPATFALTGLALLAMWLRLKTRSLWPAIAAHLGYNGLLVAAVYLAALLAQG